MDDTKEMHSYYVYILTNKSKIVLYVGITDNLKESLLWHRNSESDVLYFTHRYSCYHLVYYENFQDENAAVKREKKLRRWSREKKEILINKFNINWNFLDNKI